MAHRHESEPPYLLHFSEDPGIERFVPHVPATNPEQAPMVWTDHGGPAERLDSAASRIHGIEERWLERVRRCELFAYRLAPAAFTPWPDADGYWVAREVQEPLDVAPVGDLLERHRSRAIELRVLEDLRPLRDAVLASGYRFSMCRMANLAT